MTNLIPSARRRWINRGRVLVGLPIACGLFLSSLLFLLVLRPIWQDVQELERRRDSLLNLQRNLPALQQQRSSWHRLWATLVLFMSCIGSRDGRRPPPWR